MTPSRCPPRCQPIQHRQHAKGGDQHPEGLHEAFATLYLDIAEHAAARRLGVAPDPLSRDLPDADAGLQGMRFVEAALRSSARDGAWEPLAAHSTIRPH